MVDPYAWGGQWKDDDDDGSDFSFKIDSPSGLLESWTEESDDDVWRPPPKPPTPTPRTKRKRPKVKRPWYHKPWYSKGLTGAPPYPYTRRMPEEIPQSLATRLNFDMSSSGSSYNRSFLPAGYSWQGSGTSGSLRQQRGPRIIYRPEGYQSDTSDVVFTPRFRRPARQRWVTAGLRIPSGAGSARREYYRQIASRPAVSRAQRTSYLGDVNDWGEENEWDDTPISQRLDSFSL